MRESFASVCKKELSSTCSSEQMFNPVSLEGLYLRGRKDEAYAISNSYGLHRCHSYWPLTAVYPWEQCHRSGQSLVQQNELGKAVHRCLLRGNLRQQQSVSLLKERGTIVSPEPRKYSIRQQGLSTRRSGHVHRLHKQVVMTSREIVPWLAQG